MAMMVWSSSSSLPSCLAVPNRGAPRLLRNARRIVTLSANANPRQLSHRRSWLAMPLAVLAVVDSRDDHDRSAVAAENQQEEEARGVSIEDACSITTSFMDQASAVLIDGRSPAESGGALTSPAQLSALEDALPVLAAYIADYESERNAYDLQTYVFALFDFEVRRRNKMINPIDLERYEELEALTDNALKLLKVYAQQAARGDLPMPELKSVYNSIRKIIDQAPDPNAISVKSYPPLA